MYVTVCFFTLLLKLPGLLSFFKVILFNSILFSSVLGLHCWAGFYPVAESRGTPWLWCVGSSCCRARVLGCMGFSNCSTWAPVIAAHGLSGCGSQGLEHRLNRCGARAWLQHVESSWVRGQTWSPALAGRFCTTEPPGKPLTSFLNFCNFMGGTQILLI